MGNINRQGSSESNCAKYPGRSYKHIQLDADNRMSRNMK